MVRSRRTWLGVLLLPALAGCGPGEPKDQLAQPKLEPGKVTTAIGSGQQGYDGDGHGPLQSWLNQPSEVSVAPDGSLYVVDWNNHRIRALQRGRLQTLIGARLPGDWPPALAPDAELQGTELALNHPMDVAFATTGEVYIAAWHNHKLLELEPSTGLVRRLAGGDRPGYDSEDAAAADALLNFPASLVVDASGAVIVADQRNNVVRRVSATGARSISTLAGLKGPSSLAGEGGPAASAGFGLCPYDEAGGADNPGPGGALALDSDGNLYVADTYNHCVRRIHAGSDGLLGAGAAEEELIETIAGHCGRSGFDPDPTPAELRLNAPRDVEVHDGHLYIADSGNHVVWRLHIGSGIAERVVGTGEPGGEGSASTDSAPTDPLATQLNEPYGIALDGHGNLFIADTLNNRIRVLGK